MLPQIKTHPTTKFIGKNLTFTYADYRMGELWSSFMPRRNEILNKIGNDFYNIQINPDDFDFNPNTSFIKWAAVPVTTFDFVPEEMQTFEIEEGLYAVFNYKGNASGAQEFFSKIFTDWLPSSDYKLDNRPNFEILGDKYKKNDPNSEEEIWIPIQQK